MPTAKPGEKNIVDEMIALNYNYRVITNTSDSGNISNSRKKMYHPYQCDQTVD